MGYGVENLLAVHPALQMPGNRRGSRPLIDHDVGVKAHGPQGVYPVQVLLVAAAKIGEHVHLPFAEILKEALIKAGKGEVSSQKRRKCQGKERIEGRNPWNSYTSQLKGRKSPMRVGVNRPLWQAYTDLRWRRARVIG